MRDVEEAHTAERADEEDDVKPAVVEIKLQVAQHLCDDRPAKDSSTMTSSQSNRSQSCPLARNSTELFRQQVYQYYLRHVHMCLRTSAQPHESYLYSSGMFMRMSRTDEMKYIP